MRIASGIGRDALDSVTKRLYEAVRHYGSVRDQSIFGIPASYLLFAAIRAANHYCI